MFSRKDFDGCDEGHAKHKMRTIMTGEMKKRALEVIAHAIAEGIIETNSAISLATEFMSAVDRVDD